MLLTIEAMFRRLNRGAAKLLAVVLLLMVANVFFDVVMRYFFRAGSVGMQELEWHLFSIIILYGISVALLDEGHVRVDFLYDRFSPKARALINLLGTVLFVVPLALLILFGSLQFVADSYQIREISQDPGGLPLRWLIKAMIPLSFAYLLFCAVGYSIRQINLWRGVDGAPKGSSR